MNVFLCGARGFIGTHVHAALTAQGHTVTTTRAEFATRTSAADWLPDLRGVDAVINAVGVLRESAQRPLQATHSDAPRALFDACVQADVARVVQISALGIERSATRYASTKQAADRHLLQLTRAGQLQGTVLRSSVVFGKGGAASQMFVAMSKLPALLLPEPVLSAQVQPIAVHDLARGVAQVLAQPQPQPLYECVGTQPLSLREFIASLRAQQGRKPAIVGALPEWITNFSASVGDHIPGIPWCSEALALLANHNTSDAPEFAQLLGQQLPLAQYWEQAWLTPGSA